MGQRWQGNQLTMSGQDTLQSLLKAADQGLGDRPCQRWPPAIDEHA
jgi:hypothetical protein